MNTENSFKIAVIIIITLLVFLVFCLTNAYLVKLVYSLDNDVSIYLAIFNLAIDMAIGILTVWGLAWAAQEFQANQEKPELALVFSDEDSSKEAVIELSQDKESPFFYRGITLTVQNNGTAIGLWYLVEIRIPLSFFEDGRQSEVSPIVGQGNGDHWKSTIKDNFFVYTFMSNGIIGVYPNYPLNLCDLRLVIFPNKAYQSTYEIPYVIATKEGRKEKTLILRIKQ
jgi:hypothetical protein